MVVDALKDRADVELRLTESNGTTPPLFIEGERLPVRALEVEVEGNGYTTFYAEFAPQRDQPPIEGEFIGPWGSKRVYLLFGGSYKETIITLDGQHISCRRVSMLVEEHEPTRLSLLLGKIKDQDGNPIRDAGGKAIRDVEMKGYLRVDQNDQESAVAGEE